MRKSTLIILFLFHICDTNAQTKIKHKKEPIVQSFIQTSLSAYSSNLYPGKYPIRVNKDLWDNAHGHSYNLQFGLAITKKVDVVTGVSLNNFTVAQVQGYGYWYCDPSFYHATEVISTERNIDLHSLEIPLGVRYKFKWKKFYGYPSIGIRAMYYTDQEANISILLDTKEIIHHPSNDRPLNYSRTMNISPFLILGANYKWTKNLKIITEIFCRYNLLKDDLFNQSLKEYETVNIESLGISVGLEYALKMK